MAAHYEAEGLQRLSSSRKKSIMSMHWLRVGVVSTAPAKYFRSVIAAASLKQVNDGVVKALIACALPRRLRGGLIEAIRGSEQTRREHKATALAMVKTIFRIDGPPLGVGRGRRSHNRRPFLFTVASLRAAIARAPSRWRWAG
jgi:hypothetical protein